MTEDHSQVTTLDYANTKLKLSLGIVKPHAYKDREAIEQMIEGHEYVVRGLPGTQKLAIAVRKDPYLIPRAFAALHYEEHRGKPFYNALVRMMCEGPSELMIIEGSDAIHQLSVLTGPTDPKNAPKGTIRERFGEKGDDIMYNAFHRSANEKDARREIRLYFEMEELPPKVRDLYLQLW